MDNLLFNIPKFYSQDSENGGGTPAPQEKLYNQDELNGIIGSRLAQERAKIYKMLGVESDADLNDIQTKLETLESENATLKAENDSFHAEQIKAEKVNKLKEAGVDPDFIDVALVKWDGEQELAEFVKENHKLTVEYFESKGATTGASLDGKGGGQEIDLNELSTDEFMKLRKEGKI